MESRRALLRVHALHGRALPPERREDPRLRQSRRRPPLRYDMAKITIIDGPDLGCEYPLPERGSLDTVVIGRDPGADIVLNDQAASREHCRLVGTRQGHRLVDLGSRNRTFVNGEPIEEAFLRDGDVVRIGDTDLRFEDEGAAIETTGVASTIIREIPINGARRKQASFIEGVASSGVKAEDVLDELEE